MLTDVVNAEATVTAQEGVGLDVPAGGGPSRLWGCGGPSFRDVGYPGAEGAVEAGPGVPPLHSASHELEPRSDAHSASPGVRVLTCK